jgi:uracil-DNA glycosylase
MPQNRPYTQWSAPITMNRTGFTFAWLMRWCKDVGMTTLPPNPAADSAALRACQICAPKFAATATAHAPRPVVWFQPSAQVLIAGQAPGARVHATGRPFSDRSGDRLRDWMGVDATMFYDQSRIAIVPMAFCFPGYDAKGSDLPPPPICARTWRAGVLASLPNIRLILLVGGAAQRWHLGIKTSVTDTVAAWRDNAPTIFPLPHPSWRNTRWVKQNPWFETDVLPALRVRLTQVLNDDTDTA